MDILTALFILLRLLSVFDPLVPVADSSNRDSFCIQEINKSILNICIIIDYINNHISFNYLSVDYNKNINLHKQNHFNFLKYLLVNKLNHILLYPFWSVDCSICNVILFICKTPIGQRYNMFYYYVID